jgi:hypothetical protein
MAMYLLFCGVSIVRQLFQVIIIKNILECAAARQEPEKAAAVLKYSAMQRLLCYDS